MKKSLLFFIISIICVVALRYLRPDFSWFAEAFAGDSSNIADMNQPMPNAALPAVDEGWVDMESYKGKVVLISFWTTWCPACRDEMPELIKLQQKLGPKGFTVVALSVDDQGEESVETFVQTEHFPVDGSSATINFPVLLGNEEIARKLGFEGGLPASVLRNPRRQRSENHSRTFQRPGSFKGHQALALIFPFSPIPNSWRQPPSNGQ